MFDLVTFLFSIYNSENMDYILVVYWSLHPRIYDKGNTAGIYGVYTMEVHNYSALKPATEEIYQKYGVYTMEVRNYSALASSTEYLRRRYMENILWWYIITSPSHLRKRRYSGNLEYILWRCSNFFAIAFTMEGTWRTYYGGIETSPLSYISHGGDQNTAEIQC